MFNIDTAISDLNSYGNLQYQVNYIIDSLDKTINTLSDISNHLENYFVVDDVRIDNKEINTQIERLVKYRNYMNLKFRKVVEDKRKELITNIEDNGYNIIWG